MKLIVTVILFLLTVYDFPAYGQTTVDKKVFVSSRLDYLQFITDTTIWTSIEGHDTTSYFIKADTLFIKSKYWQTGAYPRLWHDYKILQQSTDTLTILNSFSGDHKPIVWQDTLQFVNLNKLEEPITSFKYLNVSYSNPFDGSRSITIDSTGRIIYNKGEIKSPTMTEVFTTLTGNFSKAEFSRFLDTLSYTLPSRLNRYRGTCSGTDASQFTFTIKYNDKTIVSRGCTIDWVHAILFQYVYSLDQNKGFVNRHYL